MDQNSQREKRIEQVLEKVSIVDLLDALKVDYNNGRKIHCIFPDHQEKTPSMVVYEHSNSVYCFGCGESGGVVRLTQFCVPVSGKVWSVERALSWLEDKFDLDAPRALESLSSKIGKTLQRGAARIATDKAELGRAAAVEWIDRLVDEIKDEHSTVAASSFGGFEDYIYDELERPGTDVLEWSVWAQKGLKGYYHKQLRDFDDWLDTSEFLNAAREIAEDELIMEIAHLDFDERG